MTRLLVATLLLFVVGCGGSQDLVENRHPLTGIVGGEMVQGTDPVAAVTVQLYSVSYTFKKGIRKRSIAGCTGTLISNQVVLTAAHCTEANPQDLYIYFSMVMPESAGTLIDQLGQDPLFRQIQGGLVGPEWPLENAGDETKNWGDIALLKFPGGLPPGYRSAQLAPSSLFYRTHDWVTLAGYGLTDGKKNQEADSLNKVDVRIAQADYSSSEFLVGDYSGKGSCRGDSGGPAFYSWKGRVYILGVTSRSNQDLSKKFECQAPSVYTSVPFYGEWIESGLQVLQDESYESQPLPQPKD